MSESAVSSIYLLVYIFRIGMTPVTLIYCHHGYIFKKKEMNKTLILICYSFYDNQLFFFLESEPDCLFDN